MLAQNPSFQPQSPFGRSKTGGPILRRQSALFDAGRCIQYGICGGGSAPQTMVPGAVSAPYAASGGKAYTFGPGSHPEQKYLIHGNRVGITGAGLLPLQEQMAQKELERQVNLFQNEPISSVNKVSDQPVLQAPVIPAQLPTAPVDNSVQMSIEEAQIPQAPVEPAQASKNNNWLWIAVGVGAVFFLLGTKGSSRKATI